MKDLFDLAVPRRVAAGVLVALLLVAAACGGGDGDGDRPGPSGGGTQPTATAPAGGGGSDATPTTADAGQPAGEGPGSRRAVVTIGGETFEADMSTVCISLGGAVAGIGFALDGKIGVNIDIPPEDWESSGDDWEPPSVRIDDDRQDVPKQWEASAAWVADIPELEGRSQVDSFTVEGRRAYGTATFTDIQAWLSSGGSGDRPEPVAGTFDIDCG